ncbi:DUF1853 family protein [uncultured Winogradskyella sp.]|uniref:DUF1853 family protein n=1 Tax=uncultured Winogradskyella sp. TaxID=395353 RepID=UPI0026219C06|nr:DUF1853 family protein [uncultured Winogradskyella sp.]
MAESLDFKDRFIGFQNTALLWNINSVKSLVQFSILSTQQEFCNTTIQKKLRLGKWIEVFTLFQLQQMDTVEILAENLQIKNNKQTIGEIDLLLLQNELPIHLEIAYKFYLYDDLQTYLNPLDYWIGPNRNDSLSLKLKKLKDKQLPLLHKPETKTVLKTLGYESHQFEQFVNFKAQLFLPYHNQNIAFDTLNKACIKGFYIHFNEIELFRSYQFYIPNKLDWLVEPKLDVNWLSYNETVNVIERFMTKKQSPLCWLKDKNNQLSKCFITWW